MTRLSRFTGELSFWPQQGTRPRAFCKPLSSVDGRDWTRLRDGRARHAVKPWPGISSEVRLRCVDAALFLVLRQLIRVDHAAASETAHHFELALAAHRKAAFRAAKHAVKRDHVV